MKKLFFLALAIATSALAQAQKIVTLGFEDGDATHTTEWALTPGLGKFGDFVNVKETDTWIEQSEEAAHSGQYGLQVLNGDEVSDQQWQRGFKIGHVPIKENTSYRVSFWMKTATKFKSSISIGREYFDNELQTPVNKTSYNYNWDTTNDEWKRISYVTFNTTKEFLDGLARSRYTTESNPDGIQTPDGTVIAMPGDGFPENSYFVVINMYQPGEYYLDDIVIEENVTVKEVTYNSDVVKIDFGYPTNIADLAQANGGPVLLPSSCVTVQQGGNTLEVEYLELHADGFMYAFFPDGQGLDTQSEEPVLVSFTPAEDCPIVYTTDKRPSADVEGQVVVFGFENEVAYLDENIDAISIAWSAPEFLSVTPEDQSFNLSTADFKEVVATFNKEVSLDYATITLSYKDNFGEKSQELEATVSEDGYSVIIAIPSDLEDNEYTLTLDGIANIMGVPMDNPITLTYAVGLDTEVAEVEVIYKSDFNSATTNAMPLGWLSKNEDNDRLYSLDGNGNPVTYGTGSRVFDGFSGDFTKALYWGSRGTDLGYCSFGEIAINALNDDGTINEELVPAGINLEDVSLYLTPRKYNVSFQMAAWKAEPVFRFQLVDANDNIVAQFNDYTAKPNMNGNKGRVTGILSLQADFTIEEEGYYVMKFESQGGQWREFLLAGAQVITMPSKAAYYNGLLAAAREKAAAVVDDAFVDEDLYGGETLDALDAEVEAAKSATYHGPSEIYAEIAKLEELMNAQLVRMDNIDKYNGSIDQVKDGLVELADTKYANVDVVAEVSEIVAKYGDTNPSTLSNEELAEVAPKLVAAVEKLGNVQVCTDILTYGISRGIATAEALQSEDFETIDAAAAAVTDDRELAAAINEAGKMQLYKQIVAGAWSSENFMTQVRALEMANLDDETAIAAVDADSVVGIDFTGYVANPKMYRVNGNDGLPGWTITTGSEEKSQNIAWGGDAPTTAKYVQDQWITVFGDACYKVEQQIAGLPVGKYAVVISTRTPLVDKNADYGKMFYYNAQNDETQVWDKYIYANSTATQGLYPFLGGSWGYGNDANNTAIRNVEVGEDGALTIGIVENYTSGKAMKHEDNTEQTYWTGTSFVDDVRLYFVAPLEGYDYAKALADMETTIETVQPNAAIAEIYNANGVRIAKAQKGVNIVKMTNGKVVKLLVK